MSVGEHDNETRCESCGEWVEDQSILDAPLPALEEKWCRPCCMDWEADGTPVGVSDEEHERGQRAEQRVWDSRSGRYDRGLER